MGLEFFFSKEKGRSFGFGPKEYPQQLKLASSRPGKKFLD
jgi:hypothetical protein